MNNQSVKQNASKIRWRTWLPSMMFALVTLILYLLNLYLADKPDAAEWYATTVFPPLARALNTLSNHTIFTDGARDSHRHSACFLGLVVVVIRSIRKPEQRFLLIGRTIRFIIIILSVILSLFYLLLGFNYHRQPLSVSMALPVRDRPVEELARLAIFLVAETNEAREHCLEDEQGVFCLQDSFAAHQQYAIEAYRLAGEQYPVLARPIEARAKGVILSRPWSHTQIVGVFNPVFAEANINTAPPSFTLSATICHELAHVQGIAREDEANFLAFLTGRLHDHPDVRYSANVTALISVGNRLYKLDPACYQIIFSALADPVRRDLTAQREFWRVYEGPVEKIATAVNDQYLKLNRQIDGVYSYGRAVDLMLAWYEQIYTQEICTQ